MQSSPLTPPAMRQTELVCVDNLHPKALSEDTYSQGTNVRDLHFSIRNTRIYTHQSNIRSIYVNIYVHK